MNSAARVCARPDHSFPLGVVPPHVTRFLIFNPPAAPRLVAAVEPLRHNTLETLRYHDVPDGGAVVETIVHHAQRAARIAPSSCSRRLAYGRLRSGRPPAASTSKTM